MVFSEYMWYSSAAALDIVLNERHNITETRVRVAAKLKAVTTILNASTYVNFPSMEL